MQEGHILSTNDDVRYECSMQYEKRAHYSKIAFLIKSTFVPIHQIRTVKLNRKNILS